MKRLKGLVCMVVLGMVVGRAGLIARHWNEKPRLAKSVDGVTAARGRIWHVVGASESSVPIQLISLQIGEEPSSRSAPKPAREPRRALPVVAGPPKAPDLKLPGERDQPLSAADIQQFFRQSDVLLQSGEVVDAHRILSDVFWQAQLGAADRAELVERLAVPSQRLFFSNEHWLQKAYEIRARDTLEAIGKRFQISWEYLQRVNGIANPRNIRIGQKLKVVQGPFDVLVDLSDFELIVLLGDRFVCRYDVGIGKQGKTPIGTFAVREKLKDPTYYGPQGVVAAEDPENPLGERWIDIGGSFGIHGTIEPDSIGKMESEGCIRLLPDDVEELYDLMVVGSRVRIQP